MKADMQLKKQHICNKRYFYAKNIIKTYYLYALCQAFTALIKSKMPER